VSAVDSASAIGYRIRITEYTGAQPWDTVVADLQTRLPRLADFIAREYASGEPFNLPRDFDREQALRLVAMLNRLGLEASLIPQTSNQEDLPPEARGSGILAREVSLGTQLSRFVTFVGQLPDFGILPRTIGFGLFCRLTGALVAIPAWYWVLGDWFTWRWSATILMVIGGWLLDVMILWIGGRLVLPGRVIPCSRIEASLSPVYLLEAIPLVGLLLAPCWRTALRVQGIASIEGVGAGQAALVILVPWMGALAVLGSIGIVLVSLV